jgi:fatty-acyl-CoA synthase
MPNPVMNLGHLLTQTANLHPNRPALTQGEVSYTYRQLNQRVDAMAQALIGLGLAQGDRVLVQSRNVPQMFESMWAIFTAGLCWAPVNFRMAPGEVAFQGGDCDAAAFIYEEPFQAHADAVKDACSKLKTVICIGEPRDGELSYDGLVEQNLGTEFQEVPVSYDDMLWLFYTSGTTGRPKGGILTHGQIAFVVNNHLAELVPGVTFVDASLIIAPLSHASGLHAFTQVAVGANNVMSNPGSFDPVEAWHLIEKYKVSNMFTVPTLLKRLVECPAVDEVDHSSLKNIIYAGAPTYRTDQEYALKKLGPVIVQYFGQGEVTGNITVLPTHMHTAEYLEADETGVGTCGFARKGMQIAILDDKGEALPTGEIGNICVKGPAVCAGYYNRPEATEKAFRFGWWDTGDVGRLDKRGLLFITGRASDMYISGGSNVYPREIEEAILSFGSVTEAAIIGVPDPQWGESGMAILAPIPGQEIDIEALKEHLSQELAKYKWPKRYIIWDEVPKTAYGKMSKKLLKEMLEEQGLL